MDKGSVQENVSDSSKCYINITVILLLLNNIIHLLSNYQDRQTTLMTFSVLTVYNEKRTQTLQLLYKTKRPQPC